LRKNLENTKVFNRAVDALVNRKKLLFVAVDKENSLSTLFDKIDLSTVIFLERYYASH
jgi:hypothetical protein